MALCFPPVPLQADGVDSQEEPKLSQSLGFPAWFGVSLEAWVEFTVAKICGALALLQKQTLPEEGREGSGVSKGEVFACPPYQQSNQKQISLVFTWMHLCLLCCREEGPNPEVVLACNMLKTAFTAGNHRVAACLGQFT